MNRTRTVRWAAFFVAFAGALTSRAEESLAKGFPTGAVFFGELKQLKTLVDGAPYDAWKKVVESSKPYRDFRNSENYERAQAGVKLVESLVGYDLQTLLAKLGECRFAVGVYAPKAGAKQPDWLTIVHYPDKQLWSKIRPQIETLATLAAPGKVKRTARNGRQVVALDDKVWYFTETDLFVGSNRADLLESAGQLLAGKRQDSLAANAVFQKTAKAAGGNVGTFFLDNKVANALAKNGRWAPEKMDNFFATLLLQDSFALLSSCDALGGALDVDSRGVKLSVAAPGDPNRMGDTFRGFFLAADQAGSPSFPKLDNFLSGFTLHRHIAELYNNREKLIVEAALPDFDKFESGINNIIPGKNFAEDLLPMLGKQLTFVAAKANPSGAARPAIVLPSMALIAELDDPKKGSELLTLFFQAIVPVMNFTAKEAGNKPQIIAMEKYNGVDMTFARYLEEPSGDKLPVSANFRVASATVGNQFILASSPDMCKQLIDTLKTAAARVPDGRNLVWNLSPSVAADCLKQNFDALLAGQVREGRKPEEAKANLEMFLGALRTLGGLELSTQVRKDDFRVQLELRWK